MRKKGIRFIALAMIICICFTMKPITVNASWISDLTDVAKRVQFASEISALQSVYRDGEYWNAYNACGYEGTGTIACPSCAGIGYCDASCPDSCGQFFYNGTWICGQCIGFACKMWNKVFGTNPYAVGQLHRDASLLQPGDIVYGNLSNFMSGCYIHAIFITDVNGNTVTYADCNSTGPCRVKWGRTTTKDAIQYAINQTRNNNNRLFGYITHSADGIQSGGENPQIVYSDMPQSIYYMKNVATKKYLHLDSGLEQNKQNISVQNYLEGSSCQLMVVSKSGSGYNIRPNICVSKVVNAYGDDPQDGANVNLWDNVSHSSQQWGFQKVKDGYVIRCLYNPSLCLTTENGNVLLRHYNESSSQVWDLKIPVINASLSEGAISLASATKKTISISINPASATNQEVKWSSSNSFVASVEGKGKECTITGFAPGTATITATVDGKQAKCAVTVTAAVIPVKTITLNTSSKSINIGDTYTIQASVSPNNATNKTVSWSSSNTAVATVSSSGVVKGIKAGTATITAKAGGKTATCSITVKAATVSVTKVTLNRTSASVYVGSSVTLKATVTPSNATNKAVTWSSSNTAVAKVSSSGVVKGVKAGTATITAKSGSKTATCKVTVSPAITKGMSDFVERMYTVALGRASDASGKKSWTSNLASGKATGASVVQGFLLSPEFKSKNMTDSKFLDTVYLAMFNRKADIGGKNNWLGMLAKGVSRDYVICQFASSAEFAALCKNYGIKQGTLSSTQNRDINPNLTAYVNRLYTKVLGRAGEEGGLNSWCGAIMNGSMTPKQVAYQFVFSGEFISKNYNNDQFVTIMYRSFMGREADGGGKQYWLGRMSQGASREEIFNCFAESDEFKGIVAGFGL